MKSIRWIGFALIIATSLLYVDRAVRADDETLPGGARVSSKARAVEVGPIQPGGTATPRKNEKTAADASPATATPAAGGITPAQLQTMLVNLGCDVTDLGGGLQQVHTIIDNYNIYTVAQLSSDLTAVWFTIRLGNIADPDKVPASVWAALLAANYNFKGQFVLVKPSDGPAYLLFMHAVPNTSFTPMALRNHLEGINSSVVSQVSLWDQSTWPKAAGPATVPATK